MMHRLFGACAVCVVIGIGCKQETTNSLPPPAGSGVSPPAVPEVSKLMATPEGGGGTTSAGLSATGTLYADEEAQLAPKMSGVLRSVSVEEGQTVKKGQVVFRVDSVQADLGVQQAQAQLDSANVGLRSAELDYQRTKELHARGSVPQATFDQVQARYDAAKSSVAQAKVALSIAQRTSGDAVVRSPIDGVVTAKLKSVGEMVTMTPPTVVLVVQDVRKLELRARLPERQLASLEKGSKLTVSFPALGIERTETVERVNPAVDPLTRTVEVIAMLDNADGRLKPGMLAEVRLGAGGSQGGATTGATSGGAGNDTTPAGGVATSPSAAARSRTP